MQILVIPTTDWLRHPVPNRLNFIFDILAKRHEVYVMHFNLKKFKDNSPRTTECTLLKSVGFRVKDPSLYYILNAPSHYVAIKEAVKKYRIEVILSSNILPSFLANYCGVPVVFDYLDHFEESASIYYPDSLIGIIIKKFTKLVTRFNITRATEVITVSGDFEMYLHGLGLDNVTVIPNGVDTYMLTPTPREEAKAELGLTGKKVIGYIGSLEYWVDLETVIEALPELDATLLIVGPGLFTDYGGKLRQIATECGVAGQVIFTGGVDFKDLNKYISAMDIGLNPLKHMKKNELTIGGKVFNYLSCGIPVLSSRMVALEHFFGDQLYYYDDRDSFVNQVRNILINPVAGEDYRSIALQYDWKILAEKYEQVLTRAADNIRR
ncbi:MAG TPA: glycosyltransferase [Methanoregulaceae archaeon]|nr:glycosyltransferase [Methanoregulaceae archaeon]